MRPILAAWAEVTGTYVRWLRYGDDDGLSITHEYPTLRVVA